jgi:hypothetical protein
MKSLSDRTDPLLKLPTYLLIRKICYVKDFQKKGFRSDLSKISNGPATLFPTSAVTVSFQNPGSIPAYPKLFFIGIFGQF